MNPSSTGVDNDQRYDEIIRSIARRRPFGSAKPEQKPRAPQDRVLDLLNAFDALAELQQREFKHILCYGPKPLSGQAWSGVVVWYHSKGYHGYRSLKLLGAWAHYRENKMMLSIGIRPLSYRAAVYDPGVYRVAIRNNFRIYYDDDGHPPEEGALYRAPFNISERLNHRQALNDAILVWRNEIEAA